MSPQKSPIAVGAVEGAERKLATSNITRRWPARQFSSVEDIAADYAGRVCPLLAELRAIADARNKEGHP